MVEHDILSIRDRREINQSNLDSFIYNKNNMFETSADLVINKLIEEKFSVDEKYKENAQVQEYRSNWFAQFEDESKIDVDLEIEISNYHFDNYCREEELWALMEMKIIYAYKFFEINIKKLLMGSFSLSSTKDFYKWNSLIAFLNSKNIEPKGIIGYSEIFQLREINNSLKHSDSIEERIINKIPEFKEAQVITYKELGLFYNRVKDYPVKFLIELSTSIYDEIYNFNDDKINNMAIEITLRMEKKDALKLIEKIKTNCNKE